MFSRKIGPSSSWLTSCATCIQSACKRSTALKFEVAKKKLEQEQEQERERNTNKKEKETRRRKRKKIQRERKTEKFMFSPAANVDDAWPSPLPVLLFSTGRVKVVLNWY